MVLHYLDQEKLEQQEEEQEEQQEQQDQQQQESDIESSEMDTSMDLGTSGVGGGMVVACHPCQPQMVLIIRSLIKKKNACRLSIPASGCRDIYVTW